MVVPVLRLLVAVLIVVAVAATLVETASRAAINPFNFFGYFTLQSNIIGAAVLVIAALPRSRRDDRVLLARACAATYLVIVGVVYATLLAPLGAAGGVPVPWANTVLHIVTPLFFAADWLFAPDRRRLPWRLIWVLLLYPLVWCAVVLVRGATDGWVPYPFLDPADGYGSVAFFVLLIALAVVVVGAGVWGASRLHRPGEARPA